MPACMDIPLQRNEDYARLWLLTRDELGDPIDLTGCSLSLQVRSKLDNGTLIEAATVTIVDAVNGQAEIVLKASGSSALASYGNALQTVNLPYDAVLTDPQGVSVALASGNVVLSRGVTHS